MFKKEGTPEKGIPYWKLAEEFIEIIKDSKIIVSTIILKELKFKLKNKFYLVNEFFRSRDYIIIKTFSEDYDLARNIEGVNKTNLGFHDYLHIAISKRLNAVLITRDKELIKTAKKYVEVKKPEDLIS
ncbi:type II toxin-antitoxin system VapC family toxin [Candidatus Woesearchaeota archaeon]|nr:type II toxin-antitoxin system VapC family toxin [Candidatus Woesearchaeota archaeon]